MNKKIIQTNDAPQAIGTYSQGIRVSGGDTVYLSGQIGLDPSTMKMAAGIEEQIHRVFLNLKAVAAASGGSFNDIVKLNVYLTDLGNFQKVNEIMSGYFEAPYPARAAIGVASLPRDAQVEMDAVLVLPGKGNRIAFLPDAASRRHPSCQQNSSGKTRQAGYRR